MFLNAVTISTFLLDGPPPPMPPKLWHATHELSLNIGPKPSPPCERLSPGIHSRTNSSCPLIALAGEAGSDFSSATPGSTFSIAKTTTALARHTPLAEPDEKIMGLLRASRETEKGFANCDCAGSLSTAHSEFNHFHEATCCSSAPYRTSVIAQARHDFVRRLGRQDVVAEDRALADEVRVKVGDDKVVRRSRLSAFGGGDASHSGRRVQGLLGGEFASLGPASAGDPE